LTSSSRPSSASCPVASVGGKAFTSSRPSPLTGRRRRPDRHGPSLAVSRSCPV
jgi:hypothetical protein